MCLLFKQEINFLSSDSVWFNTNSSRVQEKFTQPYFPKSLYFIILKHKEKQTLTFKQDGILASIHTLALLLNVC